MKSPAALEKSRLRIFILIKYVWDKVEIETEKIAEESISVAGNLFIPPVAQLLPPLVNAASPVSQWVLLITKEIKTIESVFGVGVEEKV